MPVRRAGVSHALGGSAGSPLILTLLKLWHMRRFKESAVLQVPATPSSASLASIPSTPSRASLATRPTSASLAKTAAVS